VLALAAAGAWTAPARAAVAFSDDFSTSTINSATPPTPTASSTDYAILSSKDATGSSIGAGHLNVTIPATSSGLAEAQARFAATPVALTAAGDYIQLKGVFTSTGMNLGGNATINFGLYNSGGVAPVTGGQMNNKQLGTTDTTFASGYAAGWLGYAGRIGSGGADSELFTRPAQSDTTDESQDLIIHDGVTGGFDSPNGATLDGTSTGVVLTDGGQYTYTLRLTRNADDTLTLDQNLYSGNSTDAANNLFTQTAVTDATTTIANAFDGLALGYRGISSSEAVSMDVNALSVETNVAVPEPASVGLFGLGALALIGRRRSRA
jgi:hypothetical protein